MKGPLIGSEAQISVDSSIGHSTRIEERASVKKSVVGRHCVILDHCIIEDGYGSFELISIVRRD